MIKEVGKILIIKITNLGWRCCPGLIAVKIPSLSFAFDVSLFERNQ